MCLGLSRESGDLDGETGLSSVRKTGITWSTTLLRWKTKAVQVSSAPRLCAEPFYQWKDSVLDISADAVYTHTKNGGSLGLEVVPTPKDLSGNSATSGWHCWRSFLPP